MAGPHARAKASRRASRLPLPGVSSEVEKTAFWMRFPRPFAGLDEAGRGCLAGPVAAAAVILPEDYRLPGLDDSKAMSARARAVLEPEIKAQALSWAIGVSWPREIDRINVLQASLRAMCRALRLLRVRPVFLAVDGNQPLPLDEAQQSIPGGDGLVPAIAAASVLAKTFRDRLLAKLDNRYPGYGFAKHKGYATREHYKALEQLGPCRMHRLTFRGVAPQNACATGEQTWLPGT